MQYTLLDLLKPEHVRADLPAADAASVIRLLNDALVRTGNTTAEFAEDACARELTFPTGLPTAPIPVAIPHADPPHVNASAVSIGTLRSPVIFGQMGTDGSVQLEVRAVFLLAIKEQEKQVEMIQQLMKVIQNAALLEAVMKAYDPDAIVSLIRRTVGG
ncbi:MAG TPA: PTS sugar transporter subunit IIA [Anaerolineales bacterium]|nr:PTS sugar transporter subunit IIA [Anaerolineales bacterium]